MRVRWLRKSLLNLEQEAAYIAQDNPKVAAEFVIHLRDKALMLGEQPNLGRPGRIPGTREFVVTHFPYILSALSGQKRYCRNSARFSHRQKMAEQSTLSETNQ